MGWLTFTGLSFEESLGAGWTQFIHPTDRDAVVAEWRASVASGQPFESEFRLRAAGGGYRWFMAKAVAVRDADGRIFRWAGAGTDITERHRSLVALKKSEARFRRLFDANLFGVVFWSEQGEIVQANDAFLAMLGYDRRALESGWLRALTLAHEEAVSEEGKSTSAPYETWFEHRDGRRVPVMVAEANTPGEGGERFTIVVDLSEREAREQFEQAFLADVAHDLRNPLAATKAQAQVMRRRLKNNKLEPEALGEGLETIIANSTRMARRIEELTDVAQLRAGHALELNREPVDLVAMAESSAAIYRQATERQAIRVEASSPSLVGLWDASRIERVIDNLLSNAVKYSPEGGPITVTIDQAGDEARLAVRDHGVGIPDEDLAAIFERFQRGSNVKGRMGGTGIGLAGARTIVEQHGGAIEVASKLGSGSIFTVRLPLSAPEAGEPSAAEQRKA
jgi:PAS domain S-box-containing protein